MDPSISDKRPVATQPPTRQNPAWVELTEFRRSLSESLVPLEVHADPVGFRSRIANGGNPFLAAVSVSATPHEVVRTRALIDRSNRFFFKASLLLKGHARLDQLGRSVSVEPGDVLLYDTAQPYSLVFSEEFTAFIVMMPRDRMRLPSDIIEEAIGRTFVAASGTAQLITPFFAQLAANLDHLRGPGGLQLAEATGSMLESVIASGVGRHETTDPKRTLYSALCRTAIERLADPSLNASQLAAAHYVSERRVYQLFQERGTTLGAWLRTQRLERCRTALLDPRRHEQSIGEIAAAFGYPEPTTFSRAYRVMFGESPTTTRRSAPPEG